MATSLTVQDGQVKISKRVEKELHNTKVVLRRLPPDMTEEKLFELFPDIPEYSYFYLAAGDPTFGEFTTARAYFSFVDEATIIPFRDQYDGLPIESAKGQKYRAVIEFSPYQGIPKRLKKKPDSRLATIEQDQDYVGFAETAHVKKEPPTMAEIAAYVDSLATNKAQEVQVTPLISYVMDLRKRGRSSKRSKAPKESKKKRSKESKASKESTSKSEEDLKSNSGTGKEWVGKSRKDKSGKKSDSGSVASTSSTSVESKGARGGSTERLKDRGKWREEGKGKGRSWQDDGGWEGRSDLDRQDGEGTRVGKKGSRDIRKSGEGRDGDRGGYKEKRSTKRGHDEERKSKGSSVRNKDRPDQPIYSARSRSRGEFNHGYNREKDSSNEGRKVKEKSEGSQFQSDKAEGWKRKDHVNGENTRFYGYSDDYERGESRGRSSGSKRGKYKDAAAYGDTTSSYNDK